MPVDQYTKLLLHCDGTDGAGAFNDETGRTVTVVGDTQLTTTQKKFGNTSGLFDGTGDYLTVPNHADWNLGTNDFTIDCWAYWNNVNTGDNGGYQVLVGNLTNVSGGSGWLFRKDDTDHIQFYELNGISLASTGTVTTGQWYHLALVRNGSSFKIYINGTNDGSATSSGSIDDSALTLNIGRDNQQSNYPMNGWIDEVRVSIGIARWTGNFTPPTTPYTTDAYTKLLLHFESPFTDETGKTVIPVGNTQIDTAQSKFGGASLLLDGTGDYLSVADNADFEFGADSFTIDCWIRPANLTGIHSIMAKSFDGNNVFFFYTAGAYLKCYLYTPSAYRWNIQHQTALSINTWYHVAFVRNGNSQLLFINGVVGSTTGNSSTAIPDWDCPVTIGYCDGYTNWNGWIDEVRISKGIARWTSNFTVPAVPYRLNSDISLRCSGTTTANKLKPKIIDQYTNLLIHCDGTDGSTTFSDVYGKTITVTGNAQIDTAQSKFGGSSLLLDGNNDFLTLPTTTLLQLSANYTVDTWIRVSGYPVSFGCIFDFRTAGDPQTALSGYITSAGKIAVYLPGLVTESTGTVSLNTWTHVAWVRAGNTGTFFINGSSSGTYTHNAPGADSYRLRVGTNADNNLAFAGWIDEFRVSKGIARWTGNFTPPTKQYDIYQD